MAEDPPSPLLPVRICVSVLTYRRPDMLRTNLASLLEQSLLSNPQYQVRLLIVDNDVEQSAEATVTEFSLRSSIPVTYVPEPERGIVCARNRVLREGSDSDFLAMIDDDEVADKDWLLRLTETQHAYNADVVSGPVFPLLNQAPEWIVHGGFFSRRSLTTGSSPEILDTNNILLRSSFAATNSFDMRFNATGGEDTYFFMQLRRKGARFVWCEEARVFETIPGARATEGWLKDRARSAANRYARCCLYLQPGWRTRLSRASRILANLAVGCWMILSSGSSTVKRVRGHLHLQRALGTLAALRGVSHVYYKKNTAIT